MVTWRNFFDYDSAILKFVGEMPLRWSDFDTLGLKLKMQNYFPRNGGKPCHMIEDHPVGFFTSIAF